MRFGKVITAYINHVITASNDMIGKRPDDVKKFLAGWFESVAYFKTHKEEVVKFTAELLKKPEPIIGRVYDEATPMIADNGHFDPKGLAAIRQSLVDTKILDTPPDSRSFTRRSFCQIDERKPLARHPGQAKREPGPAPIRSGLPLDSSFRGNDEFLHARRRLTMRR